MSDIILKNKDGLSVTYTGITKMTAPKVGGGIATYNEGESVGAHVEPLTPINVVDCRVTVSDPDWQTCEYIQATSAIHIDVGYKLNLTTDKIVVKASKDQKRTNQWQQILGTKQSYHATNAILFAINDYSESRVAIDYGSTGVSVLFVEDLLYTMEASASGLIINDEVLSSSPIASGETAYNLWLFDCNVAGSGECAFLGKVHEISIYRNNTLFKHYLPKKESLTGVFGLMEELSGTLYSNSAFTIGPVIE